MRGASKSTNPNACLNCGSLNTKRKGKVLLCYDCRQVSQGDEVIRSGELDLHYFLDVRNQDDRSIWCHTLDVLFESQCSIAEGLGIRPGSSFANWLRPKENEEGFIDDPGTIDELFSITNKMLGYKRFIKDKHHVELIRELRDALPRAAHMCLTMEG